jgi:hypothetical protein
LNLLKKKQKTSIFPDFCTGWQKTLLSLFFFIIIIYKGKRQKKKKRQAISIYKKAFGFCDSKAKYEKKKGRGQKKTVQDF